MKILLTGTTGQIGGELKTVLGDLGTLVDMGREQLDLSKPDTLEPVILDIQPDLIVNAAAYTAVDKAEEEFDLAMTINGMAPGVLAQAAKKVGAGMIHYSTDYVFDGCAEAPYLEEDLTCPLSVYGKTKLAGEKAVAEAGIPYLIFRTSWVYGFRGKNFLLTIKRLAEEKDSLRIVDDQVGAPTWSRSIAQATLEILKQCLNKDWLNNTNLSGLFHMTCRGKTSWHGFAREILNLSQLPKPAQLIAIPTSEYPTPAPRPPYSVLGNDKLHKTFAFEMPHWQEALKSCMHAGSPA